MAKDVGVVMNIDVGEVVETMVGMKRCVWQRGDPESAETLASSVWNLTEDFQQ